MKQDRIYHYIDQQSPDWFKVKLGRLSASGGQPTAICVDGKHPSGLGAGAMTLAFEKAAERITGEDPYQFEGNRFTEMGNDWEDYIADEYAKTRSFGEVAKVGFIGLGEYLGCSPDRLVGEDGLLEIKTVEQKEFMRLLYHNSISTPVKDFVDKGHIDQTQYCKFITNRKWTDLVYFTPHAEFKNQMLTFRIERDEDRIARIELGTGRFVAFVKELEQLNVV